LRLFTDLNYQQRYQPLAWLTWFTIHHFQGLDSFGYHLIVLVLHLVSTLLVFGIAHRLFAGRKLKLWEAAKARSQPPK